MDNYSVKQSLLLLFTCIFFSSYILGVECSINLKSKEHKYPSGKRLNYCINSKEKKHGPFLLIAPSFFTLKKGTYSQGLLNGPFVEYYPSGQTKLRGTYLSGQMEGEWIRFYINGNIRDSTNWKNSAPNGEFHNYYPNGKIKIQGVRNAYKYNEKLYYYDENGILSEEYIFPDFSKLELLFSFSYLSGESGAGSSTSVGGAVEKYFPLQSLIFDTRFFAGATLTSSTSSVKVLPNFGVSILYQRFPITYSIELGSIEMGDVGYQKYIGGSFEHHRIFNILKQEVKLPRLSLLRINTIHGGWWELKLSSKIMDY